MKITNAEWIRSGKPAECPVFARDFAVDKAVRHAELEITAAGVWEKVDEGELTKAQALRICGPRPKEA